jgi:hypothetical protein
MKFISVLTWFVFVGILTIGCLPSPSQSNYNKYTITSYDGGKVISVHIVDWFQFRDNGNIYFSDKDAQLIQRGLGVRLRKVWKGQHPPQYVLQIKTEMEMPGDPRVEEEDRDLVQQKIEGVSLISIIDRIAERKKISEIDRRLLSAWMERKAQSSMAPFQELRKRSVASKVLTPVVIGFSHRQRYHVLVDRKGEVSDLILLQDTEKNPLLIPPVFASHPHWIWLMEASWDESKFYAYDGLGEPFLIQELEIENKYRPREMGTKLMSRLEASLVPKFNFVLGRDSKFIRAYRHYKEQIR